MTLPRLLGFAAALGAGSWLYRTVVAPRVEWVELEDGLWGVGLVLGRNEDEELVLEVGLGKGMLDVLLDPAPTRGEDR